MVDIVDKATRSRMMSGISGKNTKPERAVRQSLHRSGFRYRLHASDLPGKPDIALAKYRVAIDINGCFWHAHKCGFFKLPATNRKFWKEKLVANVARDKRNARELRRFGWRQLIVWECAVRASERSGKHELEQAIAAWITRSEEPYLELRGRRGHAISGRRTTACAL